MHEIKQWSKKGIEKRAIAYGYYVAATGATVRELENYPVIETKDGEVFIQPIYVKYHQENKYEILKEIGKEYNSECAVTMSKSTIDYDISVRLPKINPELAAVVQKVLFSHVNPKNVFKPNFMAKPH